MDLDALRVFVRVADLGSFTRAGEQLGLSKSRASARLQALESEVGARLLLRSTRTVRLTEDGEQFLARARRLVAEADDLASMFQAPSNLRGRVRVDLPIRIAREHVFPRLPEFMSTHPQIELLVSTTDRRVDVLREGFDCVLRIGKLADSGLVARRLGDLPIINCASPAYLRKQGTPTALDDLDHHFMVDYSLTLGGSPPSFEYWDGQSYQERTMRSLITVNGTDAYLAACLAGLGLIQIPRIGAREGLANGTLVEVLSALNAEAMPVSLVQGHAARARKPVRAFMTWLAQVLAPHLTPTSTERTQP
ncbi:MAG: LysR family transcriptional regulator [Deltaproteobacteria bacterium]|nr:LysR family transcriptional regulator [Deltaproteobacteria bacterium]